MSALLDAIWFRLPVLMSRARLERRIGQAERNAFELGRDYEGAVRERTLS